MLKFNLLLLQPHDRKVVGLHVDLNEIIEYFRIFAVTLNVFYFKFKINLLLYVQMLIFELLTI